MSSLTSRVSEAPTRLLQRRLRAVTTITAVGWLIFAVLYSALGYWGTVANDLAVVLGTTGLRLWLRAPRPRRQLLIAAHVLLALSWVGLVVASLLSGQSAAMATWFLIGAPIFAAFALGRRQAIRWVWLTVLGLLIIHASEHAWSILPEFVPRRWDVFFGQVILLLVVMAFVDAFLRVADDYLAESIAAASRLRTLVDHLPDAVVLVDEDRRVVEANPGWAALLETQVRDLAGQPLDEVLGAIGAVPPLTRAALEKGQAVEVTTPKRRIVDALWIGLEADGAGLVVLRDVTEKRESERLKTAIVSTVSHELRTPLTSIRGSLGLLAGGAMGALPPQAATLVSVAHRNSEQLSRLVDDLLDLDRLEAGAVEWDRVDLDPALAIRDANEGVSALRREAGVTIALSLETPARVRADHRRLVQVLTNLLSNAIKFSQNGDTITLETCTRGDNLRFSVCDQGPGIAPEAHETVFERFRQLDASDTREHGGSGLGLAICRDLIRAQGGSIGLESAPGQGATFWFELPLATSRD